MRWILLLALLAPTPIQAIASSGLGVYPTDSLASPTPWFKFVLSPTQVVNNKITVDNRRVLAQDVVLYAVDAAPSEDGGFGMQPQNVLPTDAGSWIHLESSRLHLAPNSSQVVRFQVRMPAHPSVGPHYAGIIAQPAESTAAATSGVSLHVIARLGVRTYIQVPGRERPRLTIQALRQTSNHGPIILVATLQNGGNTLLVPTGTFEISRLGASRTRRRFSAGRPIAPSQHVTVQLPTGITPGSFPLRHTAKLQLRYGTPSHYQTVSRTVTFWTGNLLAWTTALVSLVLVAAGLAVKYCAYRHRNRHRRNQGQP